MRQTSKEAKLAVKRAWYWANRDKARQMAKKSWLKHKEQRIADNKAWLEKNKEHSKQYHKEYSKKWYAKNKEKVFAQSKHWHQNNKERSVAIVQKYVRNNQQKVSDYNKRFNQTVMGKYRYTVLRAKKWDSSVITLDQFGEIISLPCTYCGELKLNRGIDRINNEMGYTKENSAACCKVCNYMKKTMMVQDFMEHVQKIYKHNN